MFKLSKTLQVFVDIKWKQKMSWGSNKNRSKKLCKANLENECQCSKLKTNQMLDA